MMRYAAKRTTDYLLVDISNSYTKLAFATRQRLAKPIRHPTKRAYGRRLCDEFCAAETWRQWSFLQSFREGTR